MNPLRVLALAPLLVACGGKALPDDSTTSDAAAVDSASTSDGASVTDTHTTLPDGASFDFCKAAADRATKCGTGPLDPTECEQQRLCFQNVMRAEDYNPLLTCLVTRECSVKDDTCVANAAMKYLGDPTVQAYVKACNEKRTACSDGFSDDYCGYDHGLMKPEVLAKLKTCLDRSCAEVRDCFQTIYEANGCGR